MSDKIEDLLSRAKAQEESLTAEQSSINCAARKFGSPQIAEEHFNRLKEKLYRVKFWNDESLLTSFALFDKNGKESGDRAAKVGDFICVSLHGSGKDDWVEIVSIDDKDVQMILTVRPTHNPTEEKLGEAVVSHFFTADATNNFCLTIMNEALSFYVIGLNEKANTRETKNMLETVRNVATANVGSYFGIQTVQWQTFCDNFLELETK